MFYAYIYRDPRSNEPFYVGKGTGKRAWIHLRRKDDGYMARKVRKMLAEEIEPIVELIPAIDEDHAFFLEHCLISVIGRQDLQQGPLLNFNDGGKGSPRPSPEVRARMSASHIGIKKGPHSPEAKANISLAQRTSPAVLEGRKRHSAIMTGRKASEATRIKMAASQKARREAERTC